MIGQSVGSDASPLSCFLFRPRKRLEKRRKRSHTNVSNALATRTSRPPAQTAHVRFKGMQRGHTPPHPRTAHTAAYTPKQGAFRMGVLSLPSDRFVRFGNPARPGVRTANFAAFGSWSRGISKSTESLRNSDAHDARRCSEASRSRRNVQPRCWFLRCIGELHGLPSLRRNSGESFHAPCCADSFICAL